MKKWQMCIGLFDKDTHKQEVSTIDAYKIAENVFTIYTGGATITEGRGIYTHDDGSIVVEPTLVCMVYGAERGNIEQCADVLKAVLNQESIAIEYSEVNSYFY